MIEKITTQEIEDAKKVLESFVVSKVSRESALESGIFAIANQSARWERPTKIIYALREESHKGDKNARNKYCKIDLILNESKVQKIANQNGYRFTHQRRFKPLLDYFGPITDNWWNDIIDAKKETRDFYTDQINYLQCKTFSFWHLCMGGINLLPIDIHVRRQVRELGVEIEDKYVIAKERPHRKKLLKQDTLHLFGNENLKEYETQTVVEEPKKEEYERIERDILALFGNDERFLKEDKVNAGLVASVLWWRGANRNGQHQSNLFSEASGSHWQLPYGNTTY